MNRARLLLFACLVSTAAACGSDDPGNPNTPSTNTFTEVFSGTLSPGGGQTFTFISQSSGTVTVTVTALAPDSTRLMGVSLGTVGSGGACQVVIANDRATQLTQIVGSVGQPGNLCTRVYDPLSGVVVDPLTFELTVLHP
jgi:hypothetical protein